jgi:hypothetical protein
MDVNAHAHIMPRSRVGQRPKRPASPLKVKVRARSTQVPFHGAATTLALENAINYCSASTIRMPAQAGDSTKLLRLIKKLHVDMPAIQFGV